jgi:SAM-dependent methyltransferase
MSFSKPAYNRDERNDYVHRLFLLPAVHHLKRKILSNGGKMQETLVEYLSRIPAQSPIIIDLGCGTGRNALLCKDKGIYYGIDINPRHIAAATKRYGAYGSFIHGDAATTLPQLCMKHADSGVPLVILMIGLMHHLNDAIIIDIMSCLRNLPPTPRFLLTLDPVRVQKPAMLERLLMWLDRGRFIRSADQYQALLACEHDIVESHTYDDFLKTPYHHYISFIQMK